jgi:hypothetical protein
MKSWYQQFEFHTLIDLLAEETENYTRCFTGGKLSEAAEHKAIINTLMEEIKRRKNGESIEPTERLHQAAKDRKNSSV